MPNNYANCCIYKIISKDVNITELYVGYTNNYEKTSKCYRETFKTKKFYNKFIRENGDWDNFEIIKIEDFPCSSEREIETRKRYWIKELNAELNKRYLISYWRIFTPKRPERRETCICGSDISIYQKSQHLKTKRHKNFVKYMVE
jgi:hypothetical protein